MQHDPMSSGHDDPRAGVGAWTDPPLADATRLRAHLNDLARSGSDTPRPFARRRAAAIASFATDHDDDLARAGLAADRRASLLVRAARLEDAVAWEAWDEVRAIVAGMTFHLAAYLFPAPALSRRPQQIRPRQTSGCSGGLVTIARRTKKPKTASGADRPRVPERRTANVARDGSASAPAGCCASR